MLFLELQPAWAFQGIKVMMLHLRHTTGSVSLTPFIPSHCLSQGKRLPAYLSADAEEGEVSDDDSADEIEDDFKLKSSNVRETVAINMTASGQRASPFLQCPFPYFELFCINFLLPVVPTLSFKFGLYFEVNEKWLTFSSSQISLLLFYNLYHELL